MSHVKHCCFPNTKIWSQETSFEELANSWETSPVLQRYLRASSQQRAEVCHIVHKSDVSRESTYPSENKALYQKYSDIVFMGNFKIE